MIVVLAEKPSVARDIAAVLGANQKRNGYFEGNGYQVTYAFGHLVTIAEPEEMNPAWGQPWKMEQLPMIPAKWVYRVAEKAQDQFNSIKKLFLHPATKEIICATDAGREGQHIFDLIYQLTGANKPVQRLWISSLTSEAIREGFRHLKPADAFRNLSAAAAWRARADWLVGLSATRAYTVINSQTCTVGRVQTPTLALIVNRQIAIENFKPTAFYEIHVTFEPGFTAKYITGGDDPQTRLEDPASAQAILNQISPVSNGTIISVATMERITQAPPLFDLLTLQKEANRRFGYTAQETLDLAQSLYEEYKVLSYPRTESRHLSHDMLPELPNIIRALPEEWPIQPALTALNKGLKLSKTYVDDAKLTDHHAIIPTHKPAPADLPPKQRNIYQLVAKCFLSIFLPAQVRNETTAIIQIGQHSFRAAGSVIKEPGWTVLSTRAAEDETDDKPGEDMQTLPALSEGQAIPKRSAQLKEGKTAPPRPYDDASLLAAMKNAGHEIEDEDLAAYLQQNGLGTSATRAAIIEKLIAVGYVERRKKALLPTAKGKALINQVHPVLKDVALTASWEQQLADIQDGSMPADSFATSLIQFIQGIFPEIAATPPALAAISNPNVYGPCPQCKTGTVRKTIKGAGCSRYKEGCKFSMWGQMNGKKLNDGHIRQLVTTGRTGLIKGFKKKDGSGTYDAHLVLTDDFKIRLEFSNQTKAAKTA
ncbi:MAG TPA: DNA topoisomerase 3 [Candidatus Angelobacter sp.]|nr:DNA topoisomerase 3 [Candidatus Angelobacter sp.]